MSIESDDDGYFEEVYVNKLFAGANLSSSGPALSVLSTQDRHSNLTVWVNTQGDPNHYNSVVNIYARQLAGRGLVKSFTLSAVGSVAALPQLISVNGVAADGYDVEIVPATTGQTKQTIVAAIAYGWEDAPSSGLPTFTGTGFVALIGGVLQAAAVKGAETQGLVLVNGANENLSIVGPLSAAQEIVALVSGPTAPFSIGGIGGVDGMKITILNFGATYGTGQPMTIKDQDAGSAASNRIVTFTGADAVFAAPPAGGFTTVRLVYTSSLGRWLMMS